MKLIRNLTGAILGLALLAMPIAASGADQKPKPKPYPLKTCVVSGDKLGEMGDPYVFEYEGREIKLCCKNCLKDFKKDAAKYVKALQEAEAKPKK